MDDVVFRLLRELPDTNKDRYDVAYERGRAQARSSLLFGGMAIGLVAGGLGLFLLDPVVGAGRRARLAQRAKAVLSDLRNRTWGTATESGLTATPSSSIDICAGVSVTEPSFVAGQVNRPFSSRFANRQKPCPSQ